MSLGTKQNRGYSKVDKEDREERIRRRTQFLIYKSLQQADYRRRNMLRIRIRKLKVKIGKRLMILKKLIMLNVSTAKDRVNDHLSCHVKACKQMFSRKERTFLPVSPVIPV